MTSTTVPLMAPQDSFSPGGRGTITLPDCPDESEFKDGKNRKKMKSNDYLILKLDQLMHKKIKIKHVCIHTLLAVISSIFTRTVSRKSVTDVVGWTGTGLGTEWTMVPWRTG